MKKIDFMYNLRYYLLMITGLVMFNSSLAQTFQEENKKLKRETNKLLQEAEEKLEEDDFSSAEASYRKAVAKNSENVPARYNMANMYYGKEKSNLAVQKYQQAAKLDETKEGRHKIFHNLGNSYMEQKNYEGAVEAYKNALRNIPSDEETRYNLALAKKMLEKEEEEGGGDDNEDQEQDDQNKDQQEKGGKDKKEGENEESEGGDEKDDSQQQPKDEDENGDPEDQKEQEGDKGGEEEQEPQQPQPGQLSPQQIKNLLEAMNNEEKKVQDKINAEKAKGAKTRTGKDW